MALKIQRPKKLVNTGMNWWLKLNVPRIAHFMKYPVQTQNVVLGQLIRRAENTVLGKQYNFSKFKGIDDFRNSIPIQTYDSLKPYIERMLAGERHVLWPGKPKWFAETSGTSGAKSKYLPVTMANLKACHNQGTLDALSLFCHRHPDTKMFQGRALLLGGNFKSEEGYPDVRFADISAILIDKMHTLGRLFITPNFKTALMPDMEAKIEKIAHLSIGHNITNISGMPTWVLMLFRRVLEITGKDNLLEVWPNFTLFQHGGMDFRPYRELFDGLFPGDQVHYRNIYNASEGFFAVQDREKDDDMLLLLNNGVFFEFLPIEDLHDPYAKTHILPEVDLDREYVIIISTNGGLWRYILGDTIKFSTIRPFRIRVTGRIGQFINVFGEIIHVEHTDKAIGAACTQMGVTIQDYTMAPVRKPGAERNGYVCLVEFQSPPADLDEFARLLDKELMNNNSDYHGRRKKNLMFDPVKVIQVPEGGFRQWMIARGRGRDQYKIPRLSNSRQIIDEILEVVLPGVTVE